MVSKLSDIQTMEKMVTVWGYLSRHPRASKRDVYRIFNLSEDRTYCPLCTNVAYLHAGEVKFHCADCLLRDFWPGRCYWGNTAYTRWELSGQGSKEASVAATEILKASEQKLKKLEND